jgi:hypothetical protein
MQRFKRTITWVLLIFVAAAVVTVFRPRETVFVPDGLCLLFWHGETRCVPCLKMETLIRQTLFNYNDFHMIKLEYDVWANQPLAQEFNVGTTTIILVERKDRRNVRVRDLTTEVWNNINDEAAFLAMLQEELEMFIQTDMGVAATREITSTYASFVKNAVTHMQVKTCVAQ